MIFGDLGDLVDTDKPIPVSPQKKMPAPASGHDAAIYQAAKAAAAAEAAKASIIPSISTGTMLGGLALVGAGVGAFFLFKARKGSRSKVSYAPFRRR